MKKKIVMNVCAKHPAFDGRVYDKISRTLIKCGYEVHNTSPNIVSQQTNDKIFLHGFQQKNGMIERIKSLYRLKKIIQEVNPDSMICHEPDALFIAYKYYKKEKRKRLVRLIFDCHEAYEHWFDNVTRCKTINTMIGKILMFTINQVVKKIDAVTSVNNTMTERFKKYNRNSFFLPSVYKLDNTWNYISNQNTDLVYMGSFGKSKQAEMFIGAAKILKEKGILAKIAIIGGSRPDEKNSNSFEAVVEKEGLEEYFDYLGWLKREEAFNKLGEYGVGIMRFDSYTMPGNYAMPNKLFEYMSYGLAILCCGLNIELKAIIEKYKCGVVIESETAEALAEAIIYIKNNPQAIENMKNNSYMATIEEYNWQNYEQLLKHIIEG